MDLSAFTGGLGPVIIGCRTLEAELHAARKACGCTFPVVWIESGLHNTPAKLTAALEQALEACEGHSCVLLAMGFCGQSFVGVRSKSAPLILPRVDDCISLLLGSMERRMELNAQGCYFFTDGWLRGERTIIVEYRHALERYGPHRAELIFSNILRNYRHAVLLDTGCFDLACAEAQTRTIADTLHLQYRQETGTLAYLKKLLTGPWEDREFVVVGPDTEVTVSMLYL